jgi:hypothetical protein
MYVVGGTGATARIGTEVSSRELLDALDEHAIVSVADLDGRIIYANDRFCEVSGYRRDELVGQTHRLVKSGMHPPEFYRELWHTITSAQVWHGVLANRRKDGSTYWVASTIVPMLDAQGLPERYVSIRTDITHQKALEQEVREQEGFLRQVTEALDQGVLVTDAQGHCIFASAEALQLLGLRHEQVIGRSMQALLGHAFVPAALERRDARAARAARVPAGPARQPWRTGRHHGVLSRADGRQLPVALHVRALRHGRRRSGWVVVLRDDSSEHRALASMQRGRNAAELASRAKTTFLANLSHEIRTPLGGIVGLARLARAEPAGSDRQADFLRRLEASAGALSELVSDALDLTRIEAGRLQVARRVFDLRELVHSVWESHVDQAALKDNRLELSIAADVGRSVLGDPLRVRQILANYLVNALKFTRAGRVLIRVARPRGDTVRIEVRDTGIGIAPGVLASLFEPFVQADETATRESGGAGLGLSICKQLAKLMGGKVGATSTPGGGSVFWVELPLPDAAGAAGHETTPAAGAMSPPGRPKGEYQRAQPGGTPVSALPLGLRVLLAEDNEVNVIVARAMLEGWGCDVSCAANGLEAVQAVEAGARFDIVLMDLQMPVMDGRTATRRLRERFAPDELAIVALTADALASEREACLALGMNAYVTKPIDPQVLHAALSALVARGGAAAR